MVVLEEGLYNVIVISKVLPTAYEINLDNFSHGLSGLNHITAVCTDFSFHLPN